MVAPTSSPTALKWWFAVEMRRLRENSGISREQAAAAVKGSFQNIGHLETGRALPKPLELDKLLEIYGVPERADFFQEMRIRVKKGQDWWIGFSGVMRPNFNLFLGLESSAVQIDSWDAQVVPGLFQTRTYAEALIGTSVLRKPSAERVELRLTRQREVLDREEPPLVWSVLAESALRWLVGGPEVLREQLEHLISLAGRSGVVLQVLPFSAGAHNGGEATFTILSAPAELQNYPGCVYVENLGGSHYYEQQEQVMAYRNALTRVRIQATKPGEETVAYLHRLMREL